MPHQPPATRPRSPQDHLPPPEQLELRQSESKDPLTLLRTRWKWAAFSQFFFTFNHLFAMNDVSITVSTSFLRCPGFSIEQIIQNIENDLVHGSSIVLPRVMQRLLYTLTYDRKVTYVPTLFALFPHTQRVK